MVTTCCAWLDIIIAYEGIATTRARAIARRRRLRNVAVATRSVLPMTPIIRDMAFAIAWAFIKHYCHSVESDIHGHIFTGGVPDNW